MKIHEEIPQLNNFTTDFKAMVSSVTFNSFGFFFLDFLIPFVAINLQASGSEMGILFSLRTFGYLFSSTFVGFLADNYSKKNLVIIGSTGRGISYFIMYLAIVYQSFIGLSFGTTFLGFMAGFFWIPFDALIAEKSDADNRSKAYGYRNAAQGKGNLLGGLIGFTIFGLTVGYGLNSFFSYIALPIFGIANFYAGYIFLTKVDEEEKIQIPLLIEKDKKDTVISKYFSNLIGFGLLLAAISLGSINFSIARPFLIPYLLEKVSNNPTIAVIIWVPSGLVSFILAPKLGGLADRINIYVGISFVSFIGAVITFFLINTTNILFFMILLTLDTAIALTTGLILSNLISRISQKHRGKILGFRSFFEDIGALIGPILGGILWEIFSRDTPFELSIIVELLLIPVFLLAIYFVKPMLTEKFKSSSKQMRS